MAKEAQNAICERANSQNNSFTEDQFQKVGKYFLYGGDYTPWSDIILEEYLSFIKNTSDIKTTDERLKDLVKEIEDLNRGKVRFYLNGKSYGDLKVEVKQTILDRAKAPSAKAFTPQQANIIKEWTKHPFNNFNLEENINFVIERVRWEDKANKIPKKWLEDAINEFKDLTKGIERGNQQSIKL